MMVATQAEVCANGAKPISPGQRPGNTSTKPFISPERATPSIAHARALTPEFVYLAPGDEFRGVAIKSMSGRYDLK
jgi:hypothetical protein